MVRVLRGQAESGTEDVGLGRDPATEDPGGEVLHGLAGPLRVTDGHQVLVQPRPERRVDHTRVEGVAGDVVRRERAGGGLVRAFTANLSAQYGAKLEKPPGSRRWRTC